MLWDKDNQCARNLCQEGLEMMNLAQDSLGYARLLAEAGRIAYFKNMTDQADPLLQRALEMAQIVGDKEVEADE